MEINESTVLLLKLVRLSNRFHRRKDTQVNQPFEQISGLSIKAFHTLHLIQQGATQPGEVVRELGIPNSTATRLLDCLVKEGLIARRPNPEDLREIHLKLTASGRQRYDVAWAQYLSCLHAGLGQLPVTALEQAVATLTALEQRLSASPEADHD